jgi:hypothetical protein
VVVFTADGEGPVRLADSLSGSGVSIIAVTFSHGQVVRVGEGDAASEARPPAVSEEVKALLASRNIPLVSAHVPFHEIILPGTRDSKLLAIRHVLSMFGIGMRICVQAVLMATDAGHVDPLEEVISMSADTAIVATGCPTYLLFHPEKGLQVKEVICKPLQRDAVGTREPNPKTEENGRQEATPDQGEPCTSNDLLDGAPN